MKEIRWRNREIKEDDIVGTEIESMKEGMIQKKRSML